MEAKVDVRKLQLLNDRITQVMDALNQVRFSVHGLTHTGAPIGQPVPGFQLGQFGIPQQPQFGFQQQTPYGMGQPWGQLGIPQQPQLGFQQQTPYGMGQPWGQLGFQQPQLGFQQQVPYGLGQPFGQPGTQMGLQQPMMGGFGGLQHTPYSPNIPFGYAPFGQGFQGGASVPGWSGSPAWPSGFGGGLYHSPELIEQRLIEQRANDPNRILQTFPFCLAPQSVTTW
jgi:hypothetical protein